MYGFGFWTITLIFAGIAGVLLGKNNPKILLAVGFAMAIAIGASQH